MAIFANRHHLSSEVYIIQRGACVEKDQKKALSDPNFPAQEKKALEDEKKIGFWRQSKALKSSTLQNVLLKHWKPDHATNELSCGRCRDASGDVPRVSIPGILLPKIGDLLGLDWSWIWGFDSTQSTN